ncbi:Receptor-like protein [Arachis hypogaea]|nr:Receptor-like protein [Arachis hypogaea]
MVSGDDERSLLLQFKNSLTFDPDYSTKLKTWNQSIGCCDWSGVTCNDEAHVIALDLIDENIQGALQNSSSLFSLQHLQSLNLASNDFNSSIPSKFNKLETLTYLNLSGAGFVGQVPIEISQLTRLVTLDLSFYGISLDSPLEVRNFRTKACSKPHQYQKIVSGWGINISGTLPISFSKLTELKEMDLSNNNFVGPISSSALFEGMQSLSSIDLSYNSISGTIPSSLFMIPSLQYVDLSNNQFSKLEEFTDVFTSKLEYLDLSCNNLSGSIPPPIFQLRGLASLNLSNNKLSGPIPPSIIQHSGLNELDLSSNKFSGAMQIDALVQLKNLNDLDLSFNKIDDVNFTDVALSTFPQLRSLNLASCNLKTFPGFLRYQSGLNELDLSYNQIQGTVPNWIWRLYSLGYLDVSHNFLTNFEGPLQNLTQNLDTIFLQFC